jgi:hypothetical protein
MNDIAHGSWLFTRGHQSVRLVRDESSGHCRLVVQGPDDALATYDFADITTCMKRQADVERDLQAAGYRLSEWSSNRRQAPAVWSGVDQRHATPR